MGTVNFRKNDTYRNMYDGFLQIRGHVNTVDELPVSGISKGDVYTVGDNKLMYIYNESWSPMGGSDGGSVSWNDVTDKPFYTTTYPAIDLPNGIKLVIDGYVEDGAVVNEQYGIYNVGDTRFDVTLINKADNTVLEKLVGVTPEVNGHSSSMLHLAANILFTNAHMTNGDSIEGLLALDMSWSELASFNGTVRSWAGQIGFFAPSSGAEIGSVFNVPTPAKPSAVKGQDYDTVTIEDSLDGYTAYYKKPDEVKKIDSKYLPNPYEAIIINGEPGDSSTSEQLMDMGLTKEKIDAVINGEIRNVIIRTNSGKFYVNKLYVVTFAANDYGTYFRCENTDYSENGITYTSINFGYDIVDDVPELFCNIEGNFSYPINADSGQGD